MSELNTNIYAFKITMSDDSFTDPEKWRKTLGPERINSALRYMKLDDRKRSLVAGLLIHFSLKKWCSSNKTSIQLPPVIKKGPHGKPYIAELSEFHFNVSHSGKWVVCAVGNAELGVDIERTDRKIKGVARRFYSTAEQSYLLSLPEKEREKVFFDIWALKESYMKATGDGMTMSPETFTVTVNNQTNRVDNEYSSLLCNFPDELYRLAITVKTPGDNNLTYNLRILSPEELCE